MGESVLLADHFPLRCSRLSSIILVLSALPQRITGKHREPGSVCVWCVCSAGEAEGWRNTV